MTEGDPPKRTAVMTGRVAFLEPLISTVPRSVLPPLTDIFCTNHLKIQRQDAKKYEVWVKTKKPSAMDGFQGSKRRRKNKDAFLGVFASLRWQLKNKEAGHKPNFVSVIISLAGAVTGPVLAILPEGPLFRFGKE